MTLRHGHTRKKIFFSINQVRSRSGWSKTTNVLWARRLTPTVLSIKFGITQWKSPDYQSGLVITTHAYNIFECASPRDYVDTKSWLAYEQNPYLTCWVRSSVGWTKTMHALWVRCTPHKPLSTKSGANQSKNPNCPEWLGISYLGSMMDLVSDQAYALGHESFGPWCYELSHYSDQFHICMVTSLTDGQGLRHSSIYLVDGPRTQALGNLFGSIEDPTTLMHSALHWNIWCMCG
jgi:hypothetical protein